MEDAPPLTSLVAERTEHTVLPAVLTIWIDAGRPYS